MSCCTSDGRLFRTGTLMPLCKTLEQIELQAFIKNHGRCWEGRGCIGISAASVRCYSLSRHSCPQRLLEPNGSMQDSREYWSAGKLLYDPADIRVPTFLAHAEWDADLPSYMLHAYYARLTNAPEKAFIEIPEGTHTVIMEKNRMQLFEAVQAFLDK